jgi:hypothetical protein
MIFHTPVILAYQLASTPASQARQHAVLRASLVSVHCRLAQTRLRLAKHYRQGTAAERYI